MKPSHRKRFRLPKSRLDREALCAVLAEQLDEDTLARLFPDSDPAEIRAVLRGAEKPVDRGQSQTVHAPNAPFWWTATPSPPASSQAALAPDAPTGWRRLFTDGAARGNPGHAGAGALLLEADGTELQRVSGYLGLCTNNVAEYRALIIGLKEALRLGKGPLALFMDSELVVRQLAGQYKVRNEQLLPLYEEARQVLAQFAAWQVRHVPRAKNAEADRLANAGIDQHLGKTA